MSFLLHQPLPEQHEERDLVRFDLRWVGIRSTPCNQPMRLLDHYTCGVHLGISPVFTVSLSDLLHQPIKRAVVHELGKEILETLRIQDC